MLHMHAEKKKKTAESFSNALFVLPLRSTHRLGGRIHEGRSEFLYWVSACVCCNYASLRACSASGELQVTYGVSLRIREKIHVKNRAREVSKSWCLSTKSTDQNRCARAFEFSAEVSCWLCMASHFDFDSFSGDEFLTSANQLSLFKC